VKTNAVRPRHGRRPKAYGSRKKNTLAFHIRLPYAVRLRPEECIFLTYKKTVLLDKILMQRTGIPSQK
jgi:hypothetical protein